MRKFYYIESLIIAIIIFSLSGCAKLTMPEANQALGQLRIGNEEKAWNIIVDELENPGVTTQVELCELNGITVQILQQVFNKDYLPNNKEEIGKKSYEYVEQNCQAFKRIVGITEHNYGRMLMSSGKPGLAIPHIKESMKYVQKGSFDHIMKEDALADIYASLGKFPLRDYHRLKALSAANVYFSKPRSYRWNTDEFNEWSGYGKILNSRLNELSWEKNVEQNLPEMHRLWKFLQAKSARWSANETKYLVYTRSSQLFAQAGDISFAWKLHNSAKKLVNRYSRKFKQQGLADLKLSKAQILMSEKKYQQSAKLMQEWIENYSAAYAKQAGSNAYRLAGIAQEYAGNYDKAIIYLEKSIANIEVMRASFEVEMRDSLIGGLVVTPYWSLIRSYANRYAQSGMEKDFKGALKSARMLRGRQFGELVGIDVDVEKLIDIAALRIKPKELLLDVIMTDRTIIIFAISSKEHNIFEIPYKRDLFVTRVKKVKGELSQPMDANVYIKDIQYISNLLLGPVKGMLKGSKRLIVIPDGELNGIPFTLLSTSTKNYYPLILEHEIVLTPSLSYLVKQRSHKSYNKSNKIFAMADPVYEDRETPKIHKDDTEIFYTRAVNELNIFVALPETRKEVKKIAQRFPSSNVSMFLGNKALESIVKSTDLKGYEYLHFATHGILGNQIPGIDEPALVLATEPKSSGEDGFLTLSEVQELKINSGLTVLSACDTGSGEYFTGEGVMGLSRGFLIAGSQSVLVSLWPVASQATVELMELFYANLSSGKSKAESLRLAQLSMMESYKSKKVNSRGLIRIKSSTGRLTKSVHPFYWAPFVLIGE
ncbi:MAG: CHAT domain-containing protein [Sulfurimonas sp.]|nr:CHAT domain-containing protein [Sulfurimonas sp.]